MKGDYSSTSRYFVSELRAVAQGYRYTSTLTPKHQGNMRSLGGHHSTDDFMLPGSVQALADFHTS